MLASTRIGGPRRSRAPSFFGCVEGVLCAQTAGARPPEVLLVCRNRPSRGDREVYCFQIGSGQAVSAVQS
jgi:hypothetical protein